MNVHMGCSVCLYAFYSIFNLFFFFCGLNAQWTHNHTVWRPVSFLFILMFSIFQPDKEQKKQTRNRGSSKIEVTSKSDNWVDFAADRLSSQEHSVLGVAHLNLFLATKHPSPDQSYIFHTEDPWHCLGMFRCSVNKYIKLKLIKYNNVQMRTSVYCCGLSF